jgi:mannose-6-phosphate isomerase-like protein (cupin superfamily)
LDALALLTGDAQDFVDRIWSSRVHLHRTEPEELVGLLPLEAVDELLTSTAIRTPAVRLVRDGSVLASSSFTRSATLAGQPLTGLVDARKVLDHFRDGATVVLQGLHRYWAPLTLLARDLEIRLGHPCQVNAYLTPPGSQGFATHQDTHDVFVVQTHGTKQWEVGDDELVLSPGVSLYLPTGTPHSARSQQDPSLHVTIGVNRLTWRDAMLDLAREALADHRYDAPLPAGYLEDPARLAGPLADELATFGKALGAVDAEHVARARVAAFLTHRPALLAGALADAVTTVDDDTTLERRPGSVCVLRQGADRLHVYLGDRELRVPPSLAPALELVRDRARWQVRELPLDEQSRLVLARRLLREGLLRVAR